ncbi:hypothetical protein [Natronorubrum tibetense]|uniref:Uncharacterized protein n=1 Tax=Natronorubrum tibetense GA33 TaxID=1114856 RepID=L9VRW1_9EURY|nr:hypothetical protein [Natronorubrum tibetense]ELY39899.1 hypothetical protein C496_14516 [Natronorubrum tibetense GA33]
MQSRLSRRSLLAVAGGISLAGCLDTSPTDGNDDSEDETDSDDGESTESEGESDAQDAGGSDNVGLDTYNFEVDVPEERHEEALENLLEGIEMINNSEEGDELYMEGEIVSYTDDGNTAEIVVEYPEGYSDPDEDEDLNETAYAAGEFIGERIVISVLIGRYAYNANSLPETFETLYIEDGADEPFETSTSTAEEAAEYYEEDVDSTDT